MVRDGRDVAASFKGRHRPEKAKAAVAYGAARWVNDTGIAHAWSSHPQVLVVRYERLVKDTSATLRTLFSFLGEEYSEEEIVAFYTQSADWNRYSSNAGTKSSSDSSSGGSNANGGGSNAEGRPQALDSAGVVVASMHTNVVQKPADEAAGHEQLRSFQVTQPLYDGTGRWQEPAPRGLTEAEHAVVMEKCSRLLAVLGYIGGYADDR